MNHLISHIEYLIKRHDCVVMPGWGAFIASRVEACYDDLEGVYHAPKRFVSFNPEVIHDDGMIAASISRKEKIPFLQASKIVGEEISSMRHQLVADREISLGHLGRLVAQDGSTPVFEPSPRFLQCQSLFFDDLKIPTLVARRAQEQETSSLTAKSRRPFRKLGIKVAKIAASIAVAVGIGYGLLAPIASSRRDSMATVSATSDMFINNSQTSIAPISHASKALKIATPKKSPTERQPTMQDATQEIGDPKQAAAKPETAGNTNEAAELHESRFNSLSPRLMDSDPYCLIVASLPTRSGAEKFMNENRGFEFGILEQDGKFRVYAATGQSSSQALSQLSNPSFEGKFQDAWVCRRK